MLKKENENVNIITLDQYFCFRPLSEIFLLKLDLQGGELEALRGAENLLKNGSIPIVSVEAVLLKNMKINGSSKIYGLSWRALVIAFILCTTLRLVTTMTLRIS